ncbi:MAG: ABC transporter substrate-binding protein [Parvibaculaceae bacterium]
MTSTLTRRMLLAAAALAAPSLPAMASAEQAGTVTVGWVKSTANLMMVLAPELAGKHGLAIETINFNTAVDISTAMISGEVDIGLLTPIHLIRAIENDLDFVQFAGNTRGNTGIVASSGLQLKENDWAGLRAKAKEKKLTVASSRGSINEILSIGEFAGNGINVGGNLDLVNLANFSQHPQALRSGDFDMIITLEPLASLAVAEGTGSLFSRPYGTGAGDLNTGYVAKGDWLGSNADKAAAFVRTLHEAAGILAADKPRELKLAKRLTGMSEAVLTAALANNRYELDNGLAQMRNLARLAFEQKYAGRDVSQSLAKHVEQRFLHAVGIGN